MPTYDYCCIVCKRHIEIIQKITDAPLVECTECGGKLIKLLYTPPSFELKGSGWYVDGYSKKE